MERVDDILASFQVEHSAPFSGEQLKSLSFLNQLPTPPANHDLSPTAEAQWHLQILAYAKALQKGYRIFKDPEAEALINKAIYYMEKSVHRAFGAQDAQNLIKRAAKSAEDAYIGSK